MLLPEKDEDTDYSRIGNCLQKARTIAFRVNRSPVPSRLFAKIFHALPDSSSYEFYIPDDCCDPPAGPDPIKITVHKDRTKLLIEHSHDVSIFIDMISTPPNIIADVLSEVSLYPLDSAISKMEYLSAYPDSLDEIESISDQVEILISNFE